MESIDDLFETIPEGVRLGRALDLPPGRPEQEVFAHLRELASRNVTCNAVAPGFVATAMTDRMTDEAKAKLSGEIPLERLGTPEDIAAAVAFLASEEASYVTGTVLNVSGGLYM